jgi:hypothetical protein
MESTHLPFNSKQPEIEPGDMDHKGRQAMWNWVFQPPDCLRFGLMAYNDEKGVRCNDVPGAYKCSCCKMPGRAHPGPQRQYHRQQSSVSSLATISSTHTHPTLSCSLKQSGPDLTAAFGDAAAEQQTPSNRKGKPGRQLYSVFFISSSKIQGHLLILPCVGKRKPLAFHPVVPNDY